MTKKEMAFTLAKEIALTGKKIEMLQKEQPDWKEGIETEINIIKGIKKAAEAFKIDVEKQIMPYVRYMVTLTYDDIKEFSTKDMQALTA